MNIQKAAQEIVDATASIVGGRTINIMNNQGFIIASSDVSRIGNFHEGAAEVISSGGVVILYKDDLQYYRGAKEGINMPIVIDNEIFGVVGIHGDPDEVNDVANLLSSYVRLYFTQVILIKNKQLQNELRTQLLKLILYRQDFTDDKIQQMSSILNIKIEFPIRTLVISLGNGKTDKIIKFKHLDKLSTILITSGYLDPDKDIYGVVDECFVMLKRPKEISLDHLYNIIKSRQDLLPSIAMSEPSKSLAYIPYAYNTALTLALSNHDSYLSMDEHEVKLDYFMHSLEKAGRMSFFSPMYKALLEYFGEEGMEELIKTVEAYCDNDGSLNKAAKLLHIHKNTMYYRIKKIWSIMGIENEKRFTRECFLQILLIHSKNIS